MINNKCLLYKHLIEHKIEVPKFFIVKNKTELKKAADLLNYGQVPIVIKPCVSNGSRGVRILMRMQIAMICCLIKNQVLSFLQ